MPDKQPRWPTATLMGAAALLEDEARAIFDWQRRHLVGRWRNPSS